MPIMPGTHELGQGTPAFEIKTKRGGAAAKAGHDLVIEVTSWGATLQVGEDPGQISLDAHRRHRVHAGDRGNGRASWR